MISVDGAALLAQVLPVGMIVLALDARLLRIDMDSERWFRRLQLLLGAFSFIALMASILAEVWCVRAVLLDDPLEGIYATLVYVGSLLLLFAVAAILGGSMLSQFFPKT